MTIVLEQYGSGLHLDELGVALVELLVVHSRGTRPAGDAGQVERLAPLGPAVLKPHLATENRNMKPHLATENRNMKSHLATEYKYGTTPSNREYT